MSNSAARLGYFVEIAVVFVLRQYVVVIAAALALGAGIALPSMPLLKYTYLLFALVLVLLVWLKARGESWSDFGLVEPRSWWRVLGFGILLAVVDIALDGAVRSVTTPLIVAWTGADPHLDAKTFAEIKGNLPLFLLMIPSVWLFAAFGEEVLFRGYLMTRLAQIFGGGRAAWTFAIIGQAVAFALAHWYQGPVGMVPIATGAILNGIACVAWGRTLWPAIIAHGLIDTLGFTLLYLGQPIS